MIERLVDVAIILDQMPGIRTTHAVLIFSAFTGVSCMRNSSALVLYGPTTCCSQKNLSNSQHNCQADIDRDFIEENANFSK